MSKDIPLVPYAIESRKPKPTDVEMGILYCGICHSDLHLARNEWGMNMFPNVRTMKSLAE